MPGPIASVRRFSPLGVDIHGRTSGHATDRGAPTYRCPMCRSLVPAFQLRNDVNGTPRMVEVTGRVCDVCMLEQDQVGNDDLLYR